MKKIKFKKRFNEDFEFYLRHRKKFTFCGAAVPQPLYSPDGLDAKSWFYTFDSTGQYKMCKHRRLAHAILTCKKGLNWQIKCWKEGKDDALLTYDELLAEFDRPPEWLKKILKNIATFELKHLCDLMQVDTGDIKWK